MKRFQTICALLLSAALCCALFAGCSASKLSDGVAAQDYPITIGDVTIQEKPQGVAVFSDNLADVILTMGYEITLKARSASCTQEDLSLLPERTPEQAEEMKAEGVQLALLDAEPTEAQRTALEGAGIQLLVLTPATNREDLTRLYTQVGAAMNGGKTGYLAAERAAESTLLSVDEVSRLIPESAAQPTACYLFGLEGEQVLAATGDQLSGKLLEYAGYTNNFSDSTGGVADLQSLLVGNPEYLFCAPGMAEQLRGTASLAGLSAVQNGRIYEIESAAMTRQGHTLFDTVGRLASIAHPEILTGPVSAVSSTVSSAPASSSPVSSSSAGTVSAPADSIQQEGVLQSGDTGSEVLRMQQRLDALGYMYIAPSGNFGSGTAQCVKDFQLYNGLSVTGIADQQTLDKLYSDSATPYPGSDR